MLIDKPMQLTLLEHLALFSLKFVSYRLILSLDPDPHNERRDGIDYTCIYNRMATLILVCVAVVVLFEVFGSCFLG